MKEIQYTFRGHKFFLRPLKTNRGITLYMVEGKPFLSRQAPYKAQFFDELEFFIRTNFKFVPER